MAQDNFVRHFRQIVVWPLQLMPLRPGQQIQRHWQALDTNPASSPWREVADEFATPDNEVHERLYKEFVTFVPYVQRFLYGSRVGQEASRGQDQPSMHVFRRTDIRRVRIGFPATAPLELDVVSVDLYFFLDADIAFVTVEIRGDELPLATAQDVLFRFGRAYPAFWDLGGQPGNCPTLVEWLGEDNGVLARSDFEARSKYVDFVARYRAPYLAAHWEYLLRPLALEFPGQMQALRYRQLEYYRMPFMSYLAFDDPTKLTRADWIRLGLVARPGEPDALPYAASTLVDFERDYCDDRFWGRTGEGTSGDTRFVVTGQTLSMVGRHSDALFSGRQTGILGQFRRQYFLVFLIAQFNKAALMSIADELAVAMNRLMVGESESVKQFKRTIRQMMEVFLRFTHRYWFHEVSKQGIAQQIFARLSRHLGTEELYNEVRAEVTDMNTYLDSDSARRQANTILRLTVVTIFGLIGTIATGFLGMNLVAAADSGIIAKSVYFALTVLFTGLVTVLMIVRSKRLADFLDTLSDERAEWSTRWRALRRTWSD